MTNPEIYDAIIEKNGINYQAGVYIEECAELIKELTKLQRDKGSIMKIAEEIGDVLVCIESLIYHFDLGAQVMLFKKFKIERLKLCYIEGDET